MIGIDYKGRICGVDEGVTEKEQLYYLPDGEGLCVSSCPAERNYAKFECMDEYINDVYSAGSYNQQIGLAYVSEGFCNIYFGTKDREYWSSMILNNVLI